MSKEIDQGSARALTDAGYMPLSHYLELAAKRGWQASPPVADKPDKKDMPYQLVAGALDFGQSS